tara:strand:+ start:6096 stop:6290 length:195 start_codon:yes stop_codon:yes gene_type:complete
MNTNKLLMGLALSAAAVVVGLYVNKTFFTESSSDSGSGSGSGMSTGTGMTDPADPMMFRGKRRR